MMAEDPGYTNFVCDRNNEHSKMAKPGTPDAGQYRKIKHVRADGTEQIYLLCDPCYTAFKALADKHDTEFNAFMAQGKGGTN